MEQRRRARHDIAPGSTGDRKWFPIGSHVRSDSHQKSPLPRLITFRKFLSSVALSLGLVTIISSCAEYAPPHEHGEKIYRNVLFASPGGHPLRMDLYVPPTVEAAPVVIWIFGGSWRIGSKAYHVNVRDLTRHGMAVAAIQYRLSGTATYPAQIEDCAEALRWLQSHGSHYHIDPSRIGLSGESAGGHLAALLGTMKGTPSVRAVFAMYPPTDLVTLGRKYANPQQPSDIDRLFGGPIEQKLKAAREVSPVNHVTSSSPPFLLMHGSLDELVPLQQSEKLNNRLHDAGVESTLIVVPGKGHWFRLTEDQLKKVADFFRQHFRRQADRGPG